MSPFRQSSFVARSAAVAGMLVIAASAAGQPVEVEPEETLQPQQATFDEFTSLRLGYEYQFGNGIKGPGDGDVDVARYSADFILRRNLARDLKMQVQLGYQFSDYDFDGEPVLGPEPWTRVHRGFVGLFFDYEIVDDWTIRGGPVLGLSFEEGADWDDAINGGGLIGFTHKVDESLRLGAGIGIVSQLEENTRFFPVVVIDWEITDNLRLTTNTRTVAFGRIGAELAFELSEEWEIALGAAYDERRFRLNDRGPQPSGVGEDRSFPIWLRATYRLDPRLEITGHAGIRAYGEFKVDDAFGRTQEETDFDPPFTVGVTASILF
jgi:hypothetical protein